MARRQLTFHHGGFMHAKHHLVGVAAVCATVALWSPAWANRAYSFRTLVASGGDIPDTGITLVGFFNVGGINGAGDVAFDAQTASGGTAIVVAHRGRLRKLAATGERAPGGATFATFTFAPSSLNEWGDVAFDFFLEPEPFALPIGTSDAVFSYDAITGAVRAIALPGITPDPRGGVLRGATLRARIDDRREVVFGAIVATTQGVSGGLGNAVMRARRDGRLSFVLSPGDAAPDGSRIDMAMNPSPNSAGQVAIAGHQSNQECIDFGTPQDISINCATSIHLARPDGPLEAIALQGAPAPGGGTFRFAWSPVLNERGQVAFVGDLTPPPGFGSSFGLYLRDRGSTRPIARPGQAMPGGGRLVSVTNFRIGNISLNDRGDVAFSAVLDTGSADSPDTGIYVWSNGELALVARTAMVIPGAGKVATVQPADSNVGLNDLGQVALSVRFDDGHEALLIATPR
jgi:hypothetical protein